MQDPPSKDDQKVQEYRKNQPVANYGQNKATWPSEAAFCTSLHLIPTKDHKLLRSTLKSNKNGASPRVLELLLLPTIFARWPRDKDGVSQNLRKCD